MTLAPAFSTRSQRCEPRNPAPPVISTRVSRCMLVAPKTAEFRVSPHVKPSNKILSLTGQIIPNTTAQGSKRAEWPGRAADTRSPKECANKFELLIDLVDAKAVNALAGERRTDPARQRNLGRPQSRTI